MKLNKIALSLAMVSILNLTLSNPVKAEEANTLSWEIVGRYDSGNINPDGGITEIVSYDKKNKMSYVVNGADGTLDLVDMKKVSSDFYSDLKAQKIDIKALIEKEAKKNGKKFPALIGFEYGDMTSVSVSPDKNVVAVALQEANYNKNGLVLLMTNNGKVQAAIPAGKQPDMITFTKDGSFVLVANEGEPREGYGENIADPEGSVTIIDMKHGYGNVSKKGVKTIGFESFDAKRSELISNGVILKKGSNPSVDLEPEYISVDDSGKYAYVSLQEANSIAVLDIEKGEFTGIYGLGFKDYSVSGNELDLINDGKINIVNQKVSGILMPDGINVIEKNGETYVITANEGDGREWGDYTNEKKIKIDGEKVTTFVTKDFDGLFEKDRTYIFGGRSFSIFKVTDSGLENVYDSGADFEKITAQILPKYFNVSNSNIELDDRSGKKGPEAESVVTGEVNGKLYAFVALERTGGIMVYDITNPEEATYVNYINTRDYSSDIAGDVAPEGLCFVPAKDSVTKTALIISANEVSGTVSVYSLK